MAELITALPNYLAGALPDTDGDGDGPGLSNHVVAAEDAGGQSGATALTATAKRLGAAKFKTFKAEYTAAKEAARAPLDLAASEDRAMTEDELRAHRDGLATIVDLNNRMESHRALDNADTAIAGMSESFAQIVRDSRSDGKPDEGIPSLGDQIKAVASGERSKLDIGLSAPAAARAAWDAGARGDDLLSASWQNLGGMSKDPDAAKASINTIIANISRSANSNAQGSTWLPTLTSQTIFEKLRQWSGVLGANPMLFVTMDGNAWKLPVWTVGTGSTDIGAIQGFTAGEADELVERQPTLEAPTYNAYGYGAYFTIDNDWIEDMRETVMGVDMMLVNAIARVVGTAIDQGLTNGTGTNQPQGFVTGSTASVAAADKNGTWLVETILKLLLDLDEAFADGNECFLSQRATKLHILTSRLIAAADDAPFLNAMMEGVLGAALKSVPAMDAVAGSKVPLIAANLMHGFGVRIVGGTLTTDGMRITRATEGEAIRIAESEHAAFTRNQTLMRCRVRIDSRYWDAGCAQKLTTAA